MQIRENGGRVQFLRSFYVKEKKRTQAKLIGSMPAGATELPADLAEAMTEGERAEFAAWLEKQAAAERVAQAEQEIETLPQVLQNVASHLMRGTPLTAAQAKGMWDGTAQLRRQLTKAGYTKPNLNDSPTAEGTRNDGHEDDS